MNQKPSEKDGKEPINSNDIKDNHNQINNLPVNNNNFLPPHGYMMPPGYPYYATTPW